MTFKQITLSDKKEIEACLRGNDYRICDFCFANLWAWRNKFNTHFSIIHETLFLRFEDEHACLFYLMPVGKMPLRKALDCIRKDTEEQGSSLRLKGITEKMWDEIQKVMPEAFSYQRDRNNDEYLYRSEKLRLLNGKKLQSKRNHINRFKAEHPDWYYAPIQTTEDCNECLSLLEDWEREHSPDGQIFLSRHDFVAAKNMLENFDELNLKGGLIRANGKLVAFTLGEPITSDTFCVHVEKAADINGAYAIINQQFIEHEAAEFTYINREEDMGLENLRKAKLSYYPDMMLQEGCLTIKS